MLFSTNGPWGGPQQGGCNLRPRSRLTFRLGLDTGMFVNADKGHME